MTLGPIDREQNRELAGPSALPVLDCSGCGACCRHVGAPPGFFSGFCEAGSLAYWREHLEAGGSIEEDLRIWDSMPPEVQESLRMYYLDLFADRVADRAEAELPCLWYDEEKRSCKHYDYRPGVCREFEVGGEDCLDFRKSLGIGAPGVEARP